MLTVKSWFFRATYLLSTILVFGFSQHSYGQELLHAVRTEVEDRGTYTNYTELYKLKGEFYFREPASGKNRIKFGDEFYKGHRDDTIIDFQRKDQFIFNLDTNLLVKGYYVIDNCDDFDDHTITDTYSVMLVNMWDHEDADSLAIMTLPEGIEFKRSDYLGKSILLVTDSKFNYDRHLTPTTGKIIHIKGGTEDLYMVIEIPRGEPYIMVGADTVYNHYNPNSDPLLSFVVASYNLTTDSFNWWGRCGSPWDDIVLDVKLDSKENLLILAHHYGNFDILGTTTATGGTDPDHNILLKIDRNGNYVWSEVFEGATSEYFTSFEVDERDNIYLLGTIIGTVIFFDTTISTTDITTYDSQAVLMKLGPDGQFKWVSHLSGNYEVTGYKDLSFGYEEDVVYVAGNLRNGILNLTSGNIVDEESYTTVFILKINEESGLDAGHVSITQGINNTLRQIYNNGHDDILAFLRMSDEVSFLGQTLSSLHNKTSNFLLSISTPWDSIVAVRELHPSILRVCPNPVLAGEIISIETNDINLPNEIEFRLIDQQGFTVRTIKVNAENDFTFGTEGLVPGCYNVLGYTDKYYWSHQIVVQ